MTQEHKHVKKLYRNKTDAMLAGVLSGVGEHFAIDPTILRILFVFIAIVTGIFPMALAYLLMSVIVPERKYPEVTYDEKGNRLY